MLTYFEWGYQIGLYLFWFESVSKFHLEWDDKKIVSQTSILKYLEIWTPLMHCFFKDNNETIYLKYSKFNIFYVGKLSWAEGSVYLQPHISAFNLLLLSFFMLHFKTILGCSIPETNQRGFQGTWTNQLFDTQGVSKSHNIRLWTPSSQKCKFWII